MHLVQSIAGYIRRHGRGTQMVGKNPLQRPIGAHRHLLSAKAVELLLFGKDASTIEHLVVMPPGVVGGHAVHHALHQRPRPIVDILRAERPPSRLRGYCGRGAGCGGGEGSGGGRGSRLGRWGFDRRGLSRGFRRQGSRRLGGGGVARA